MFYRSHRHLSSEDIRIIRTFRENGAVDAEHAASADALGLAESTALHRLILLGYVKQAWQGRLYLNSPYAAAGEFRRTFTRGLLCVVVAAFVLLFAQAMLRRYL